MKDRRGIIVLALVIALVLGAVTWGVYTFKSRPYPGANDFYSRWSGVRSFWLDGLDPYGDAASLAIQEGIYGRAAREDEDPGYYAYPMYTTLLLAPLAPLPYAWAEAIWLTLLVALQVGALALLFDVFGWTPGPPLLGLSLLWAVFFYPASRGILLGQPGLLVYFLEVLALWALVKGRDGLAGAALAISTIKPQMGFLFVPFLLLWGLRERRWRLVGGFAGVWLGLMAWSFVVLPGWFGAWLEQLARYPSYTAIGSPLWVLTRGYLPFLGAPGELVITLLLVGGMLWAWWRVIIGRRAAEFGWTVALTLTVTHIVALRTASPHFVVFNIPLFFYFARLVAEDRRRGPLVVAAAQLVLMIGLWALFLLTVDAKFEHPGMYLPLPFGVLFTLLISRRLWRRWAPLTPAGYGKEGVREA
ncbi:MAG: DUF2029 domain-containing protein [Anaerolineae bacterium]|nr:DUF2029 domain-containing protein [Anaerolineae bacterium]